MDVQYTFTIEPAMYPEGAVAARKLAERLIQAGTLILSMQEENWSIRCEDRSSDGTQWMEAVRGFDDLDAVSEALLDLQLPAAMVYIDGEMYDFDGLRLKKDLPPEQRPPLSESEQKQADEERERLTADASYRAQHAGERDPLDDIDPAECGPDYVHEVS